MIWIAGILLAFVFMKLGALSILVKCLLVGLGLSVLTNAVLAVALVWRKGVFGKLFSRKGESNQGKALEA